MTSQMQKYRAFRWPTLIALRELKGRCSNTELVSKVLEMQHFSQEQLDELHTPRRTKIDYKIAWARTWLKNAGLIVNPGRSIWELTPSGWKTTEEEVESWRPPRPSNALPRGLPLATNTTGGKHQARIRPSDPSDLPVLRALSARDDLKEFRHNAMLLYALELRFALEEILVEAESCLTDGRQDKKCDALYLNRDTKTAVIAQAYQSQQPKENAKANKASDLNTAVTWIFNGDQAKMSEQLQNQALELRAALRDDEIDTIELWYCHNSWESSDVQDELDQAMKNAYTHVTKLYPEKQIAVRNLQVGLETLSNWYESTHRPILVTESIRLDLRGWFEEVGDGWSAVCTSVPASWLVQMHNAHGDSLFSANIRNYLPSRQTKANINHNIEVTARATPSNFWAYNNGITILVNKYSILPEGRAEFLEIDGMAIVNGAQTTGALARVQATDRARVLTRFVRCESLAVIDSIIRFNNSQNPVKTADFRSTDINQQRLREQFTRIPDAVYLGARRGGDQDRVRRRSNLMPADAVAQALAAFHGDPEIAYHNLGGIWESDSLYSKYFSNATSAQHIVLVYSLLSVVQTSKADLAYRVRTDGESILTSSDRRLLSYFRRRGSAFLLVAAIGSCIETILGRAVPSKFGLSFGEQTGPAMARQSWEPIVQAMLPLADLLSDAAQSGGLHNKELVGRVIADFGRVFESTAHGNRQVLETFRLLVTED